MSSVDPGTAAAAQGVRVGGVVLAINGVAVGQKDKKGVVEMIKATARPLEISIGYDADGAAQAAQWLEGSCVSHNADTPMASMAADDGGEDSLWGGQSKMLGKAEEAAAAAEEAAAPSLDATGLKAPSLHGGTAFGEGAMGGGIQADSEAGSSGQPPSAVVDEESGRLGTLMRAASRPFQMRLSRMVAGGGDDEERSQVGI